MSSRVRVLSTIFGWLLFILLAVYLSKEAIRMDNLYQERIRWIEKENVELRKENDMLRCNPFYQKGDRMLLPPLCTLPTAMQPYGITQFQKAYGGMGLNGHPGVDWAVPEGTPVRASHSGTVFLVEDAVGGERVGYGNNVKLRDRNGARGFETVYAHLSKVVVAVGEKVRQGQLLGYSGNTGFSSRPHLHFGIRFLWYCDESEDIGHPCEVLDGKEGYMGWVNPVPYLWRKNYLNFGLAPAKV